MPARSFDDPTLTQEALASLEQRVTQLTLAVERQNAQIGRIADILVDMRNRSDWNAAQMGEFLRILAAGVREVRETQIYSLIAEGPLTAADLVGLQTIPADQPERPLRSPHGVPRLA
jgi:uncharacterized coiled-coil protein SlyX